tara:strand:+ start:28626 stop:29480 length:855 start_codon:yes stop_codon:yes gene_type:complete
MITFSRLGNMGRLGNQFFQVASTIGIANKNGHSYSFPEWAVNKHLKNKIPTGFQHADLQIKESGCTYEGFDLECSGEVSIDLSGYFQSEKYFKDSEEEIRNYLTPSDEISKIIEEKYGFVFEEDTVSVHIRCGDYRLLSTVYHPLNEDYFLSCIKESGASKVLFFSDDINHCKNIFSNEVENSFFISERAHDLSLISDTKTAEVDAPKYFKEDLIELFLMSRCRTNIISNSTYSWWAAWLNSNDDKQVFAPDKWFTPQHLELICPKEYRENYLDDIIPESWKRR